MNWPQEGGPTCNVCNVRLRDEELAAPGSRCYVHSHEREGTMPERTVWVLSVSTKHGDGVVVYGTEHSLKLGATSFIMDELEVPRAEAEQLLADDQADEHPRWDNRSSYSIERVEIEEGDKVPEPSVTLAADRLPTVHPSQCPECRNPWTAHASTCSRPAPF